MTCACMDTRIVSRMGKMSFIIFFHRLAFATLATCGLGVVIDTCYEGAAAYDDTGQFKPISSDF